MTGRVSIGADATGAYGEHVLAALDSRRIIVRVGDGLDPVAATAAGALISMAARIHAHVEVDGDAPCGPNPWAAKQVSDVLTHIGAHRPDVAADPAGDLVVSFGAGSGDICVGGDDWTARIGDPSAATATRFGFGLHAAAAFGAAEILKAVLGPIGMTSVRAAFEWNLVSHTFAPADPPSGPFGAEPLLFAAAGSVNSSAAAVLMPTGNRPAHVVDPDAFDGTRNPYRYPASTSATTGAKTEWVTAMLRNAGWDVSGHPVDIGSWVQSQAVAGFDGTVLSSVDSVPARGDVTDVLARTTLSAGVDGLALHVQREHSFDEWACPNCDFVDEGAPITQVQLFSDMTGLEPGRIAVLLERGSLNEADIRAVVAAGKVPGAQAMIGRRLADLIARIYAEATVPVGGVAIRVSAPFVSWIAGTLLAAEACKPPDLRIDRRVDLDMAGVPSGAVGRRPRDPNGRCLCASPWRRRTAAGLFSP